MSMTDRVALCSVLLMLSGCQYYEEQRVLKSTADTQDEKAELMKAYRLCLANYQDDPVKAGELWALRTVVKRDRGQAITPAVAV